jgi:regulator of RNase E activity RraA
MNTSRLRTLSDYLTSEALCDVLSEMGVSGHVAGLSPNWSHAGFLGRAKTLHLRTLRGGEDPDGIYDALKSYDTIGDGDVIVVQTDAPEYAYFGELNATLAKHQGAAGAVIGGKTRDIAATVRMRFPVFACGGTPRDCKGEVTLDSIGEPVVVGGIVVRESDLVFADPGGVVVIPTQIENEVIQRAVEAISKEASIRRTLLDATIQDAIAQHGTF